MYFKHFTDDDYEAVCDFLIELNAHDTSHINWNWARFEWMYEHPEFNKDLIESVCTIPSCRGQGIAKAVIHEALNRAKILGAKRAFVISDMDFYFRLGFTSIT